MINNVVLVGRLTKDPDLRYTANVSLLQHSPWQSIVHLQIKVVIVKQILSTR